jgi:hypothetical protein
VRTELSADLSAAGVPQQYQAPILDNFQTCFRDRANAKDFSAVPESCKQGESQIQQFAAMQPAAAEKVGDALKARGLEANERNFIDALEHTLLWQIAALVVIFFLTFALPPRPRSREEMEQLAAEGAMVM